MREAWEVAAHACLIVAIDFGDLRLIGINNSDVHSKYGVDPVDPLTPQYEFLRDTLLAANTPLFVFGDGPAPQVMGAAGYLSLALAVQVTMLIMAGPPRRDALRVG